MRRIGFREFLPPELQSPIITTFLTPPHPKFDFPKFYDRLHERGYVIYFGKVTSPTVSASAASGGCSSRTSTICWEPSG